MPEWKSIDSAPKDGGVVAAWNIMWDCPQCIQWVDAMEDGTPFWMFVEAALADIEPVADATHWHPGMTEILRQTARNGLGA